MIQRLMRRLLARAGRTFNQSLVEEMREQGKTLKAVQRTSVSSDRLLKTLARDLAQQRAEIRLWSARSRQSNGRADRGRPIPLTGADLPERADVNVGPHTEGGSIPKDSILELSSCPICTATAFTPVCEYNRLLLLESGVDEEAPVYNYALCHDCGVVYARRRPVGARYEHLLERFEITLGRAQDGVARPGHVALRSDALMDEERAALRARVEKGVFVSEHSGLSRREYLPALLQDRMANSVHVELLGSLLSLKAARVLELRPRLGSISAGLRRLYNADVYAMPLFDSQQFLIREAYGIPADHRVEYDHFCIPYEGQFDLVVANHMLTHSLRPREFFATVHERLKPGGHMYLYNEPDERDFLEGGKSMINTLNAFHVQTFDGPSLVRALRASGFEPVFVSHYAGNLVALASVGTSNGSWTRMTREERDRRAGAYQRARDAAILRLPERLRPIFAGEWEAIVERSFAAGLVDYNDSGRLRLVKANPDEEHG